MGRGGLHQGDPCEGVEGGTRSSGLSRGRSRCHWPDLTASGDLEEATPCAHPVIDPDLVAPGPDPGPELGPGRGGDSVPDWPAPENRLWFVLPPVVSIT